MTNIRDILAKAIEKKASDIHINVGMPPILRKNTELIELDFEVVTEETAKKMVADTLILLTIIWWSTAWSE